MTPIFSHRLFLALLTLPLLSACRDSKVESYRIAKETDAPPAQAGAPAAGDMAGQPVPRAEGRELTWTAPAHWTSKAASSMRKATYVVPGAGGATAELAITAFPGDVGGDLANVNRWRGQLGLPPIAAAELPAALARSESHGLAVAVVDLVNPAAPNAPRMLGSIVPFEDSTWFFKLTGPDALVAAEKPNYLAFVQSIQATAAPAMPAPADPHVAPVASVARPLPAPADMAGPPVTTAAGPGLSWTAPADWQSKPASAMRKATYLVPLAGGGTAELAVTAFPGDVGGELANVNRWRGQLQLPPLAEADLAGAVTRLASHGLNFTITDFTGTTAAGAQRMLGAMAPFGGATWFFKLTGPDAAVAAQKPAFLAFLQTVQAP